MALFFSLRLPMCCRAPTLLCMYVRTCVRACARVCVCVCVCVCIACVVIAYSKTRPVPNPFLFKSQTKFSPPGRWGSSPSFLNMAATCSGSVVLIMAWDKNGIGRRYSLPWTDLESASLVLCILSPGNIVLHRASHLLLPPGVGRSSTVFNVCECWWWPTAVVLLPRFV